MKLNELKSLCDESLKLLCEIIIEESKSASRRIVLFKVAEKNLSDKKTKLQKIESVLNDYSFLFETDVKTLRNTIWKEICNDENSHLCVKEKQTECLNKSIENGGKKTFQLQLCKTMFFLPIIDFQSDKDVIDSTDEKINLLDVGFIRSSKFDCAVENLERYIPGFQSLMWRIVENNFYKNSFNNNENFLIENCK